MGSFQISEFINRPVEETFDFATDLERAPRWMPDVVRIEPLTPGPLGPGSKFRETRRIAGREHAAEIFVTEHERPRLHAASADCMGCTATYRYVFTPESGGTRVDLTAEVKGRGMAMLVAPIVLSAMKKQDGDQLARLKAAIENA